MENVSSSVMNVIIDNIKQEPAVEFELILPAPYEELQTNKAKQSVRKRHFPCKKCGKVFTSNSSMLRHMSNMKPFECSACKVSFKCRLLFDQHIEKKHENKFECDQCSYFGSTKRKLTEHKRCHQKRYMCETCERRFVVSTRLKTHQQFHKHGAYSSIQDVKHDCNECDKSYKTLDRLKVHKADVHSDKERRKCRICLVSFGSRTSLFRHVLSHAKITCDACGKKVNRSRFKMHFSQHLVAGYQCDLCARNFKEKVYLRIHISSMHTQGEYRCALCRMKFSNIKTSMEHNRIHIGVRRYKCNECSYVATLYSNLKKHIARMHADVNSEAD